MSYASRLLKDGERMADPNYKQQLMEFSLLMNPKPKEVEQAYRQVILESQKREADLRLKYTKEAYEKAKKLAESLEQQLLENEQQRVEQLEFQFTEEAVQK